MKTLAVIPARADSKEIPNKNIRIIGSHPLIYYSIYNALHSKLVTNVIVTTDSEVVRIIAMQMGVKVKWRDASLCGDDITLDTVVADAIPSDVTWDYIVTMQPTSPTLSVETLDKAITYAVNNNLDTLISAINKPQLTWGVKQGKKIPNYAERVNRQYLPPCYVETGAFVISKACVITPSTRIGKNVDIFEVQEKEAQDIDTFFDLRCVAAYINNQRVAIYVNGNNTRGIGHIYRALEIADEFYTKPDIYYDYNQTDIRVFGKTTHTLIAVNGIVDLFERCKKSNYTLFINDILSTSLDYMIGLKSVLPNTKIVNFEDDGEGISKADLVFNALYNSNSGNFKHVYAGENYYISNKTFMFYKQVSIKESVQKVFISFGGADPQNYSDRLLSMISKHEYNKFKFIIVLGRAKYNVHELLKYNKYENIDVLYDVTNMPELMTSCDIGVTSRGRTGYELALLGIPSIAMAQNQREEKHGFVCNENGFNYIGLNPPDEVIEANLKLYLNLSCESRMHYQNMLLSHNLHDGRKNVMKLIDNI